MINNITKTTKTIKGIKVMDTRATMVIMVIVGTINFKAANFGIKKESIPATKEENNTIEFISQ